MKKTIALLLTLAMLLSMVSLPALAEEPTYDLGGRVVTIASWSDGTPNENSPTYAEEMALLQYINEKYNCDLQFVTTGDWHSYMSVINTQVVSGEKIADVFWAGFGTTVPLWVENGFVVALDDYFDFDDPTFNPAINDEWMMNGQHYGITFWDDALGHVILFNKRILAENGIEAEYLYELQANGEWTWEVLRELEIGRAHV